MRPPPRIQGSVDRRNAIALARIAERRAKRRGPQKAAPTPSIGIGLVDIADPAAGVSGGSAVVAAVRFGGGWGQDGTVAFDNLGRPSRLREFVTWTLHAGSTPVMSEAFGSSQLDGNREYAWLTGARVPPAAPEVPEAGTDGGE